MRWFRLLCLPLLCAAVHATAGGPPAPRQFVLALHQEAELAPGLSLRLEGVQDSRCPVGAQCIQQGSLIYQLRLRHGAEEQLLSLSRAQAALRQAGVLIELHPEKEPARPILHGAPPDYFIALLVQPLP